MIFFSLFASYSAKMHLTSVAIVIYFSYVTLYSARDMLDILWNVK